MNGQDLINLIIRTNSDILIDLIDINNVNYQDKSGMTLLMLASWFGYYSIAKKIIVTSITSIDVKDNENSFALKQSVVHGHEDILKLLINAKAGLELIDDLGRTALMYVDYKTSMLDSLVIGGANINHQDINGETLLMLASGSGHIHIVEKLIDYNANINLLNNDGKTALDIAAGKGWMNIVCVLNPNITHQQDENGLTFLMKQCLLERESNVCFLYENGADFLFENNCGESALSILNDLYGLPEKLIALKDKLNLEKLIDDDTMTSHGVSI